MGTIQVTLSFIFVIGFLYCCKSSPSIQKHITFNLQSAMTTLFKFQFERTHGFRQASHNNWVEFRYSGERLQFDIICSQSTGRSERVCRTQWLWFNVQRYAVCQKEFESWFRICSQLNLMSTATPTLRWYWGRMSHASKLLEYFRGGNQITSVAGISVARFLRQLLFEPLASSAILDAALADQMKNR